MSLTLEELVSAVEAIYEPLTGKTFEGHIEEKDTSAVCTGGHRDVVVVEDEDMIEIMEEIVAQLGEEVWGGITLNPIPKLWVTSYEGADDTTIFTVKEIEVLTDLNWQKPYDAMVNITLE